MADNNLNLLDDILKKAKAAGAESADAVFIESASLGVGRRLQQPEKLERAESSALGLRVFIGKKQAIVSSTDRDEKKLQELVDRAVAMAKVSPDDPYCGLASADEIGKDFVALDNFDSYEPQAEELIKFADAAEKSAMDIPGITNSEGAEFGWGSSKIALAATNGFRGAYQASGSHLSVAVVAGEGTGMERDYAFTSAVYFEDLERAEKVGMRAGVQTVARLNPRKVKSQQVPVVYAPRLSRSLIGVLASAINGAAIARGTSFLKDDMHNRIFKAGINIVDDPHRARGLRSKTFDGEGIATQKRIMVANGVLYNWFLDLRTARQLNMPTTGHASRGLASPPSPSPTNFYMEPGSFSPEDLISDIDQGFYVTEMMGSAGNLITGDYSRGASGFWIEKGQIAYPVSGVTVAGNLKDMFINLTPANDLSFRYGIDAPTIRVDGLMVAGI